MRATQCSIEMGRESNEHFNGCFMSSPFRVPHDNMPFGLVEDCAKALLAAQLENVRNSASIFFLRWTLGRALHLANAPRTRIASPARIRSLSEEVPCRVLLGSVAAPRPSGESAIGRR